MPRGNGSRIGIDATPTSSAASGIWTVREAEQYLRADRWPAQPAVPGAPTGTAGDGQVSLSWSAVTSTPPVTDYIVQFSDDAGATWSTFSDGVSTDTTATVTGLTNDTGYVFRIIAVNALGQGPAGSASGTVTPAAPPAITPSLLLHFDEADGSTSFTDSSPAGLTVTAYDIAQANADQSKFGGTSLTGRYIEATGGNVLPQGTEDFTVELWLFLVEPLTPGKGFIVLSHNSRTTGAFQLVMDPVYLSFSKLDVGGGAYSAYGGIITLNEWHHIAVSRVGAVTKMFVDGALFAESSGNEDYTAVSGATLGGASWGPPYEIESKWFIDEVRVLRGEFAGIYTDTFTPPSAPFDTPVPPAFDPASGTTVTVEALVVAGGGGGGSGSGGGGGGGAGGLMEAASVSLAVGSTYPITIGAGGSTAWGSPGRTGSLSSFGLAVARGGGGGGQSTYNTGTGRNGGSGGGGNFFQVGGLATQGNYGAFVGYGNDGGASDYSGGAYGGGGGGGADSAGVSGTTSYGGDGGGGRTWHGTAYAGGGGGGSNNGGIPAGVGGSGGGGNGGAQDYGTPGTANTGGGGGAGGEGERAGGSGGSGIVIIRAPQAAASTTGSPDVTTDGGTTIYTFTGSGSITF